MHLDKRFLGLTLMIATAGAGMIWPGRCHADLYDVPRVETLQKRNYFFKDEATLQAGYLALDAFSKYITGGASYTHSFSDFTAWEMINGIYAYEFPAGLKKDLVANWSADPATFPVINFLATTNLVFTPLYTKNLLFNSSIVHSQTSFVAGAGGAGFRYTTSFIPTIDVGVILRYYLSQSTFLKFDFRDYVFLTSDPAIKNNLSLICGFAMNFGKSREKMNERDF